jgi:hypothetical protein
MSTPKVKPAQKMQAPVEIDDSQIVSARDETIRRSRGKGYLGTILTGFQSGNGVPNAAALKQILG